MSTAAQAWARGEVRGLVFLSLVATRETYALPQAFIDDAPAWAAFLADWGEQP